MTIWWILTVQKSNEEALDILAIKCLSIELYYFKYHKFYIKININKSTFALCETLIKSLTVQQPLKPNYGAFQQCPQALR